MGRRHQCRSFGAGAAALPVPPPRLRPQDQPGQERSYKFGSLTHTDPAVRRQAIDHNLECLALGQKLGARSHTVWIGDGGNFPRQQHSRRTLARYLESLGEIYKALPAGCGADPGHGRRRAGGAIDPVATFRASGYRKQKAAERPAETRRGGGIV